MYFCKIKIILCGVFLRYFCFTFIYGIGSPSLCRGKRSILRLFPNFLPLQGPSEFVKFMGECVIVVSATDSVC